MADPQPSPEIRSLTAAALTELVLDRNADLARRYLDLALGSQNMDPESPDYGDFPWILGNNEIRDKNGIEFAMWHIGPIALRYGDRFDQAYRDKLAMHARAGIAAIRRHKVDVGYTNIYLMKLTNLILLGQVAGDAGAVNDGKAALDAWIAHTRAYGITEYDSPTYSGVDLEILGDLYLSSPDEVTRRKVHLVLDYLWADLAANFFAPRNGISGPKSRSYDFIWHRGTVQNFYYAEGLASELAGTDYLGGSGLLALTPGSYHPDPNLLDYAKLKERIVRQQYGPQPGRDRYNYITPDFSIGSTSAYYGPQDLQLSVEFGEALRLPVASVVFDTLDSPFGTRRSPDRSGHLKPRHIADAIASVQEKGLVLAIADLSPGLGEESLSSVATNFIIPMRADAVYLDGERINSSREAFQREVGADAIVMIRHGNMAFAFRYFAAEGLDGQRPSYSVKYDGQQESGDKVWDAARFVVYHYQGPERVLASGSPVRVGLLMQARSCASEEEFRAFADAFRSLSVRQHLGARIWSACVTGETGELEAGLDIDAHAYAFSKINGEQPARLPLELNGRNIGAEIWSRLSPTP